MKLDMQNNPGVQHEAPSQDSAAQPARTVFSFSAVTALWASAIVLAALVVVQAGRMLPSTSGRAVPFDPAALLESPANADLVSQVGQYTIATVEVSGSEDLTIVLDSRGEDILVYTIKNGQRIELIGRESVKQIFADARAMGAGRGPR